MAKTSSISSAYRCSHALSVADAGPELGFIFPGVEVEEKAEAEDYEKLAKELTNASPLEIMHKALEKFASDFAIALW
ncbi:hypothetical protein CQW23_09408 [Capsicum baccatum]|uniref:Uncharacterized protein n=1 Tax=Capsicum baccatum TaxID=33114 RepID=A0A2G2WWT7_CAPBA|nr:hypothetical protein CQW23_09408 [Capsicum baccatum]